MPLFTIATVTLNNLDGLKPTHSSIAAQNCDDYEWLVQDGASNDGSLEYLKATNADTISAKDSGIYNAMNRLIERAQGDYIIFMNAGDTFANEGTLETLKQNIAGQDFIYGDALEDSNLKKSRPLDNHLGAAKYGMFTHHQSMLYAVGKIGTLRYNETYTIAADYDFTCKFLQQNPNALYIQKPICIFKSGGVSQQKSNLGRREQFQIRKSLNLCSSFENFVITSAQALNWQIRRFMPWVYWLSKRR